jgi:hypothetical protein
MEVVVLGAIFIRTYRRYIVMGGPDAKDLVVT